MVAAWLAAAPVIAVAVAAPVISLAVPRWRALIRVYSPADPVCPEVTRSGPAGFPGLPCCNWRATPRRAQWVATAKEDAR